MRDVRPLTSDDLSGVVDVLVDAFRVYPVIRFVVGPDADDYDARVRTLVGFFARARLVRGEAMFGVERGGALVGVALVSRPGPARHAAAMAELREETWSDLGPAALARYERFGRACKPFDVDVPFVHLNMLGVKKAHHGTGLGRLLIECVHCYSAADPHSTGVTLTTEDEANVALYLRFGYEIVGRATVAPELRTWGFFRPDLQDEESAAEPTS